MADAMGITVDRLIHYKLHMNLKYAANPRGSQYREDFGKSGKILTIPILKEEGIFIYNRW